MQQFATLTDEQWFSTVLGSEDIERGKPLFPLPPRSSATLDSRYEQESALRGAFRFWQFCQRQLIAEGNGISRDTRILDFGVSYGSVIRFWLRDLAAENLHGVDSRDFHLALARATVTGPRFSVLAEQLPVEDHSLDLAYSFASIPSANWMCDISRALRPGGLACIAAPEGENVPAPIGIAEVGRHAVPVDGEMLPVIVFRKGH